MKLPAILSELEESQIEPIRQKFNLSNNLILSLGSADPVRILRTLIEAYALLPATFRDQYQLVVV
jgi:hypothetical protein